MGCLIGWPVMFFLITSPLAWSLPGMGIHPVCAAKTAMSGYLDTLAACMATVINVLDPEVVVLGGGLSNIDEIGNGLPDRLARYVFSDHVATRVVTARHGDSSGVRGAAWLWP